MAIEARRGCGFRKVGGLYLVSGSNGRPCDRLPFPLTVCPTCSCGIKQTRGWTWVKLAQLMGGKHTDCIDTLPCPVCDGKIDRAGLLWIGTQFYKSPADFMDEGAALGLSRRIHAIPRGFKVGETWVVLAHPKACDGQTESGEPSKVPGIFQVWKPERIEKICLESTRDSDEVKELEAKGITPVFVPDDDKDHQGSAYDKQPDDANELDFG